MGWSLSRIKWLEGVRGGIAGWMLLGLRDRLRDMGPVENAPWVMFVIFLLGPCEPMIPLGFFGISIFRLSSLERYMHVLGGLTITICGAGMVFLDW